MLAKILMKNQLLAKTAPVMTQIPGKMFSKELFKDKEQGEELIYFTKKDVKTMKKLYSKLQAQIAQNELNEHKEQIWASSIDENYEKHRRELKTVLSGLGIRENRILLNDLMEWKKEIHS